MQSQIEILQQLDKIRKKNWSSFAFYNSSIESGAEYWLEAIARALFKGETLDVKGVNYSVEGLPFVAPPFTVTAAGKTITSGSRIELWCKVIMHWEEIERQKIKQQEHEYDYGY